MPEETLPLSVLDFVGIEFGETAHQSVAGATGIAQAVEQAGTTDVDAVRKTVAGQTFKAPSGYVLKMDETNHHLHKPVMIGEIQDNGQFEVVWETKQALRAQPWSPFIPGNAKKISRSKIK